MKRITLLLTVLAMLSAACGAVGTAVTPSPSATASVLATRTPTHTPTPVTLTFTPTPVLFAGTLTIKVNVRSGPGTTFETLGQLDARQTIQILSRDVSNAWYKIIYAPVPQGVGWVSAQYVTLAAGAEVPPDATPTPAGPTGLVILRLNVRSGPATTFDSLGLLEPGVPVALTGKNGTASWFQIDFPSGPGGHGWVSAQYIQTGDSSRLPALDDYGNLVEEPSGNTGGTPGATVTSTVGPAIMDGDSSANPFSRVVFSATGTHRFTYSSQVSSPEGDGEDWVEFTPHSTLQAEAHLTLSLACSGNGTLAVELYQAGAPVPGWGSLACGDAEKPILLPAGIVYQLRLSPDPGSGLQLVAYMLSIQNGP